MAGIQLWNLYRKNTWIPVFQWLQDYQKCLVEEREVSVSSPSMILSLAIDSMDNVSTVKAKATDVIMNSLTTKQTQETIQHFEQQLGLRHAGYTPCNGLTTKETKYLWVSETLHKFKPQSGEIMREKIQLALARSSLNSLCSSSKQKPRGCLVLFWLFRSLTWPIS